MITKDQQAEILRAMAPYMVADSHGKSTVRNLYFDTDDHILARHSIAKPDFKEKLRIRSYSQAAPDSTVFVELKRKFDHVVYKRRIALPESTAMKWTQGFAHGTAAYIRAADPGAACTSAADPLTDQMAGEIGYFLSYYGDLRPAAFLSYDRLAYRMRASGPETDGAGCSDPDFRVTFDENILFRDYDLSLQSDVYGTPLLEQGKVLMELKCSGGMPLWMAEVLSANHIYRTSFSKYGTAYTSCILPAEQAGSNALRKASPRIPAGSPSAALHHHPRRCRSSRYMPLTLIR